MHSELNLFVIVSVVLLILFLIVVCASIYRNLSFNQRAFSLDVLRLLRTKERVPIIVTGQVCSPTITANRLKDFKLTFVSTEVLEDSPTSIDGIVTSFKLDSVDLAYQDTNIRDVLNNFELFLTDKYNIVLRYGVHSVYPLEYFEIPNNLDGNLSSGLDSIGSSDVYVTNLSFGLGDVSIKTVKATKISIIVAVVTSLMIFIGIPLSAKYTEKVLQSNLDSVTYIDLGYTPNYSKSYNSEYVFATVGTSEDVTTTTQSTTTETTTEPTNTSSKKNDFKYVDRLYLSALIVGDVDTSNETGSIRFNDLTTILLLYYYPDTDECNVTEFYINTPTTKYFEDGTQKSIKDIVLEEGYQGLLNYFQDNYYLSIDNVTIVSQSTIASMIDTMNGMYVSLSYDAILEALDYSVNSDNYTYTTTPEVTTTLDNGDGDSIEGTTIVEDTVSPMTTTEPTTTMDYSTAYIVPNTETMPIAIQTDLQGSAIETSYQIRNKNQTNRLSSEALLRYANSMRAITLVNTPYIRHDNWDILVCNLLNVIQQNSKTQGYDLLCRKNKELFSNIYTSATNEQVTSFYSLISYSYPGQVNDKYKVKFKVRNLNYHLTTLAESMNEYSFNYVAQPLIANFSTMPDYKVRSELYQCICLDSK